MKTKAYKVKCTNKFGSELWTFHEGGRVYPVGSWICYMTEKEIQFTKDRELPIEIEILDTEVLLS